MENFTKTKGRSFLALLVILVSLEIYCAKISYENYGWWMPTFLYMLTFLNLIPVIFSLKNKQTLAIVCSVVLAVLIVPNQLMMAHKYVLEREEGANITNYIYQQKLRTGKFPENLNSYKFKYPQLQSDFSYTKDGEDDFSVQFSVGTSSTSHFFSHHGDGKWQYYDD